MGISEGEFISSPFFFVYSSIQTLILLIFHSLLDIIIIKDKTDYFTLPL